MSINDFISRKPWFGWLLFLATVAVVFLLGILASSIVERRSEAKYAYRPPTDLQPFESDNSVWGKFYPREYKSWLLTADTSFRSRHAGNKPLDLLATDPELVILDEPFTGLDPVNTERVKQLLLDLRERGKAVILSTHQMNQVEAVCDRILMVNDGRSVLYGALDEIRAQHRGHSVLVQSAAEIPQVAGVVERRTHRDHVELVLDPASTPQETLEALVKTQENGRSR